MSEIEKRKITKAFGYIKERICDDVGPIVDRLIEKGTFDYTIIYKIKCNSKSPLEKSCFLLRRILDKNAGKDFLDVLIEIGKYEDVLRKIYNQDESREETFRCKCSEMASRAEDKLGEMRAEYERRLQQIQEVFERRRQEDREEFERRRQEDRDEFEKKRQQDREEMLEMIETPRRHVNRENTESESSEIISLKAEIASLRNRIEELQRTLLKREQESNDMKEELGILQKQLLDKETILNKKTNETMQFFILLCAF